MKLSIDLDLLKEENISLIEFALLWSFENDADVVLTDLDISMQKLQERGFILISGNEEIILTKKARKLFKMDTVSGLEELSTQYRELFPNLKVGTHPCRSNIREIQTKFTRFFDKYKFCKYTSEEVLQATRNYLKERELNHYKYISTAKYFILKRVHEGEEKSDLATWIDNLREGNNARGEFTESI